MKSPGSHGLDARGRLRSAAQLVCVAVVAGGVGVLPAVFSPTATLALAVVGMAVLGALALRRTLQVAPGPNAAGAAAAVAVGPRLTLARLLFYLGSLSVGWATLRVGGLTVSELFFIFAFFASFFDVLRGRPIVRVPTGVLIGTGVFVLGGAISTSASVDAGSSVFQTLHGMYVTLLWVWTGSMVLQTRRHVVVAVVLWTVSIAIDGVGALAQVAGVHAFMPAAEGNRMTGLTDHPNDLGGAAATALVPALLVATLAAGSRNRMYSLIGWIPSALIAAALVLSASVAGMAAGAIAVLLWLSSPGVRSSSRVAVAALVVCGLVALSFAGGRVTSPIERLNLVTSASAGRGDAGSGEERLKIVKVVWPKIVASPVVGVGLDAASATVQVVSVKGVTLPFLTHGLPIAAWYEAGIFGLLGLVCVLYGFGTAARRAMAGRQPPDDHLVGWALCAATVGFIVYVLSAPLVFQQYGWIAAILLVSWSNRSDLGVDAQARAERDEAELRMGRSARERAPGAAASRSPAATV